MKLHKKTVLISSILILFLCIAPIFTNVNVHTPEKIDTYGEKTDDSTKIQFVNETNHKILAMRLVDSSNNASANFIRLGLGKSKKINVYYTYTDSEYSLVLTIRGKLYELKNFPYDDATSITFYTVNGKVYVKYMSISQGVVKTRMMKKTNDRANISKSAIDSPNDDANTFDGILNPETVTAPSVDESQTTQSQTNTDLNQSTESNSSTDSLYTNDYSNYNSYSNSTTNGDTSTYNGNTGSGTYNGETDYEYSQNGSQMSPYSNGITTQSEDTVVAEPTY